MKNILFVVFFSILSVSFAQRGKDGIANINSANIIVNEYTTLTSDASVGNTSINVLASGLNTNNRFSGNLTPGDLIMIIQMQGATILGQADTAHPLYADPGDATWGSITNYNNCGNYELRQVAAVPNSSTITIDCGLLNNYSASGKVQVVRVPRYKSLTITSSGILTCQLWNGTTGGVLAVEVNGSTTINSGGKISTAGKGFRGATLYTPATPRSQTLYYSSATLTVSANKGEGIAGYDNDYSAYGGKYCRGAAANAGGGGNVWNCGGGGGANAGSVSSWTGQGNPDTSVVGWSAAWNLESPGFAYTNSSGGGRGGYSFSADNKNATVDPPNSLIWGGYARVPIGGLGGRPLDYSTGRIFMGGGGGGGEKDNNKGGIGGAGGGIIYFTSYGTITGSGNDSIIADGSHGGNSFATPPITSYSGKDGSGGAGGGGTILLNTFGASGLVLSANGGNGGNQMLTRGSLYVGAMNEAEGPGGGGGGGYIALNTGTVTQIAYGGKNGTTNSDGLTEFPANGATKGDAGLINQTITRVDTISTANVTICGGDSTVLTATINGSIPATVNWYNSQTGGSVIGTGTITTPVLSTTTTYYAGLCPGTYRVPVVVTVQTNAASVSITQNPLGTVCPGTPITFTAAPINGGTTPAYHWLVNGITGGTDSALYTSSSLINNDTVKCIMTSNSSCASGVTAVSNPIVIAITPNSTASVIITSSPSGPICAGTSVNFMATPMNGGANPVFQWQKNGTNVGGNSAVYSSSAIANGDVITCTMTSNAACVLGTPATSNTIAMIVNPLPTPSFASNANTGCPTFCIQFTETSGVNYNSIIYHFGDGDSATISIPIHCYTQVGTYSVTVSCTDANNCSGTIVNSNMITLVAKPIANFSVSPTNDITITTAVSFTNASVNNSVSNWNFGDPSAGVNNTSTLSSPSHTYAAAGVYCVELLVQNQAGCTDSTNNCVTVTNDATIDIPNVFTPNGDGKNDVFFVTTKAIKELDCVIYDRWGLKIAEWNTVNGSWDGRTKSGTIAPDGVYFYIVNAKGINGKAITDKGFLTLLKEN